MGVLHTKCESNAAKVCAWMSERVSEWEGDWWKIYYVQTLIIIVYESTMGSNYAPCTLVYLAFAKWLYRGILTHTHTEYRILCALYFDQSWHRSVVLLLLLYAGPFDTHDIAPAQPSAHLIIMKHANACCISPQTQSYCRSGKKSPTSYPHTVRSTWKIPSYNNNNKTITTWTKNCHRKPNRYFFHFHSHEIKNGLDFFFISLLAICSDQFLWFAVCMMYMQCMHASATCSMLRMNGPHCDVSHNSQWAEQSKTRTNK